MINNFLTMRGRLPEGVRLDGNVFVPMRDGVKIAIDIYKPLAEGNYPVLLAMSPYIKELQQQPPELSHDIEAGATGFFVPRGYIHVVAQIRGTGFSQGQYDFFDTKQQQDGYDLVEWIAQQPWCNGNVGMIGDSYFAMIQYLVAAQQPPHLKCIAPCDGCADPYRTFCYQGGMYNSWFLGMWGSELIRQCLWPGQIEGKQPPANVFLDWASHSEDGPYYWERAARTKVDKIKVPMMGIILHSHIHIASQLYMYPMVDSPKKLVVLPSSGGRANVYFLRNRELHEQMLRWYDYWLKGIDTGIMDDPEVAIFDSATMDWRYENEYPIGRTQWTKFFLHSNSDNPASESPFGFINNQSPQNEQSDKFTLPNSFERIYKHKPVIAYSSALLETDIKVWGPLSTTLFASSTTLDVAWFVKIGDVGADGKVQLLQEAHLKASFREIDKSRSRPGQPFHPFQNPVRPEPNKIYEYQIEMRPLFYTFKKGHKIWVQIATHDIDYLLFLHTMYASEVLPVPADFAIYHDASHPSHLLLPVIPDALITKQVDAPLSKIKWQPEFMA
jgi:uncharacterized protein